MERIMYFDGHCNLCNGAVDFLIRRDHQARLKFASLQGETARTRLPAEVVQNLGTMVLAEGDKLYTESDAALRAAAQVGVGYSFLAHVLLWIPSFVRNPVYRFIARNRYRWFGRRDTCRLPSPEERQRFLP
jgi:predicted DCC family thiol-disulfide oxidoreductase YuxK